MVKGELTLFAQLQTAVSTIILCGVCNADVSKALDKDPTLINMWWVCDCRSKLLSLANKSLRYTITLLRVISNLFRFLFELLLLEVVNWKPSIFPEKILWSGSGTTLSISLIVNDTIHIIDDFFVPKLRQFQHVMKDYRESFCSTSEERRDHGFFSMDKWWVSFIGWCKVYCVVLNWPRSMFGLVWSVLTFSGGI